MAVQELDFSLCPVQFLFTLLQFIYITVQNYNIECPTEAKLQEGAAADTVLVGMAQLQAITASVTWKGASPSLALPSLLSLSLCPAHDVSSFAPFMLFFHANFIFMRVKHRLKFLKWETT